MIHFLILTILSGLSSAFIILFSSATGARAHLVMHAPALLSKLLSCDFCLSFWVNLVFAASLAFVEGPINILATMPATAITWCIISKT